MENNQSTFFIYCSWWRYKACNYTWRSVVNPLLSQIVFQDNYLKRYIIQKRDPPSDPSQRYLYKFNNAEDIFVFFRFKSVYLWYFLHAFMQSKCESHICFQIFQIINIYILFILDQTKLSRVPLWIRRAVFVYQVT